MFDDAKAAVAELRNTLIRSDTLDDEADGFAYAHFRIALDLLSQAEQHLDLASMFQARAVASGAVTAAEIARWSR